MTQARRLGRGLDVLFGRSHSEELSPELGGDVAVLPVENGLVELSVYEIDSNPFQPRQEIDGEELEQLAESIKQHGLLQPVVVRRVDDRYQIIAGERRLRAATLAGFERVPAQLKDADEREMAEIAIVENLQRKDLNPLEKATSFQQYLQRYGCTQEELAGRLKINRSTIANLIRLLELPEPVQRSVRDGKLTQGHARALLPLGDEPEQVEFAKRIAKEKLSVRDVESLVKQTVRQADAEPLSVVGLEEETSPRQAEKQSTPDDHIASLMQEFRTALGTKVDLKQSAGGRGRIVIHFASHDEFDRLRRELTSLPVVPAAKAA